VDDKVRRILTDWLNDVRIDKDGDYAIPVGSTVGFVRVRGDEDEPVMVDVFAPMGRDVPASPELYEWVAIEGSKFKFGSVRLSTGTEAGTHNVWFRYAVLGDYLDPDELKNAVSAVVSTADGEDDKLVARFGGTTFRSE